MEKNHLFVLMFFLLLPLPNIKRFLLSTYGRLMPLSNSCFGRGCRRCRRSRSPLLTYI